MIAGCRPLRCETVVEISATRPVFDKIKINFTATVTSLLQKTYRPRASPAGEMWHSVLLQPRSGPSINRA